MTSHLNDLKSQHIADEVKKVDDKVKKNITDILNAKTSLEHNKSVIDDTFFLNQSLNHLVEAVGQLLLGNQQEFTMTAKTLTCFL